MGWLVVIGSVCGELRGVVVGFVDIVVGFVVASDAVVIGVGVVVLGGVWCCCWGSRGGCIFSCPNFGGVNVLCWCFSYG